MALILLADDDAGSRELVRHALESEGHTVEVTQDGAEALERIARAACHDVLVTDIEMPALDGINLARQALQRSLKLRIVLMSGYPEQLERAASLPAERVATIVKPFTLEQIRGAVRGMLR